AATAHTAIGRDAGRSPVTGARCRAGHGAATAAPTSCARSPTWAAARLAGSSGAMRFRLSRRWARQSTSQAPKNAWKCLLPGGVGAVARGQAGDRDAFVAVGQQRDLVVDAARARAPPALEVHAPVGKVDPADPPALRRDDRAQQSHPIGAVPSG